MATRKKFAKAPKSGMKAKNPQKGEIEVYEQAGVGGDKGIWRWRLKASNGRVLADSGESYTAKRYAVFAAERMLDFDQNEAEIMLEVKEEVEPAPEEEEDEAPSAPEQPPAQTPPAQSPSGNSHMSVALSLDHDVILGGGSVMGTVTHTPVAEADMPIQLSYNKSAASGPSLVVIPRGDARVSFAIQTTPVQMDTDVTVTAVHQNASTIILRVLAPAR